MFIDSRSEVNFFYNNSLKVTDARDISFDDSMTSQSLPQQPKAAKPKDFVVFINLVDFTQDVLPKKHTKLFHKSDLMFH